MRKFYGLISVVIILLVSGCNYQGVAKNDPIAQATQTFEKNGLQPIVFVTDEGLCLLGGYSNNQWIGINNIKFDGLTKARKSFKRVDNVNIDILKGSESFNFYANQQFAKQANANGKPYYYSSPASCEDFYILPTNVNISGDELALGLNGDWEAMPREVKLDGNSYVFDPIGNGENAKVFFDKRSKEKVEVRMEYKSQFFTIHVFAASEIPKISKCISVLDLNGDGSYEVIVNDSSIAGGISVWEIYDNRLEIALSIDLGD